MSRSDEEWDEVLAKALIIRTSIRSILEVLENWPLRFDELGGEVAYGYGTRENLSKTALDLEQLANQLIGDCVRTPENMLD